MGTAGPSRRDGARSVLRALLLLPLLLAALPAPAQSAESLYHAGRKAFSDGFYDLALESFRRSVEESPGGARAEESTYLLGVSAFYAQRWEDCLAALSGFPRQFPSSPFCRRVPYWVGASQFRLGRYAKALESFGDQIARFPDESYYGMHARLLSGISLEELGRPAEAKPFYRTVTEGSVQSLWAEAGYRLANCEYREGRYQAAFGLYMKIVMDYPKSPFVADALFYLGECSFALGDPAQAEKRYQAVLSEYPESAYGEQASFRLAEIRFRDGRIAEASALADRLKAAHPDSVYTGRALRLKADALFDQGKFAESNAYYAQCLPLLQGEEELQGARYNAALSLAQSGRKEEALLLYEKAQSGPSAETAEKALYRYAVLKAELGRTADAADALARFAEKYPRSRDAEEAGRLLASLHEKAGDWTRARARWDWLAQRYPLSSLLPEYVFRRGNAAYALSLEAEALQDFSRILKEFPQSGRVAEAAYTGGFLYSRRGEYARAVPFFRAAADADNRLVAQKALYALGACYLALGEFAQSGASFDKLLAASPPEDLKASALVGRGKVQVRAEKLEDAEKSFREASTIPAPAAAEALYWLGTVQARRGDQQAAEGTFVALAKKYPADPSRQEALYRAGVAAATRGDDAKAVELFREAIAAREGATTVREQSLYELGWAQSRLGLERERLETFRTLAMEFPAGSLAAEAFFRLAHDLYAARRWSEARDAFREVIRGFPGTDAAEQSRYWAGRSAMDAGSPAEAAESYWDYLEAAPEGSFAASAADGLGEALTASGDPTGAARFYKRSQESRTLSSAVRQRLALEYARSLAAGAPDQALRVLQEIRRQAPVEPVLGESALLTGVCYAALGDAKRASETFLALYQDRRDGVAVRAMMEHAALLAASGKDGEAYDLYLKLVYAFPDRKDAVPEALFRATLIARRRGDAQGSRTLQAKLEKEYPQDAWTAKLAQTP